MAKPVFSLAVAFALTALPCVADQAVVASAPESPGTRSITLPGTNAAAGDDPAGRARKAASETGPGASLLAPGVVAASLTLAPAAGTGEVERHYQTALVALKDQSLAIAADEMKEAAKLAPENPLVLYGLAVAQARNQQPELALPNIEKALQLGLPGKVSGEAEELVASIGYAIKKNEAEQKKVTPTKLWGSYDVPLEDPDPQAEDLPGRTVFKTRLPVSRGMFLWKIESDSTIIGHWLDKDTFMEQTTYSDSKRRDPKPKTTAEEHWWLVSILINPDGSLDGSRIETCFRQAGLACAHSNLERGKVIAFKGHVESNGDLTIAEDDVKGAMTLKKKSRVTSLPPSDVRIRVD